MCAPVVQAAAVRPPTFINARGAPPPLALARRRGCAALPSSASLGLRAAGLSFGLSAAPKNLEPGTWNPPSALADDVDSHRPRGAGDGLVRRVDRLGVQVGHLQ